MLPERFDVMLSRTLGGDAALTQQLHDCLTNARALVLQLSFRFVYTCDDTSQNGVESIRHTAARPGPAGTGEHVAGEDGYFGSECRGQEGVREPPGVAGLAVFTAAFNALKCSCRASDGP